MPKSLSGQWVLLILLILAVSLALMGSWQLTQYRLLVVNRVEEDLTRQAYLAEQIVRVAFGEEEAQELALSVRSATLAEVTLVSTDGRVLVDTRRAPHNLGNQLDRPEVAAALRIGVGINTDKDEVRVAVLSRHADGSARGVVRLSLSLNEINAALMRVRWQVVAWSTLVMLVVAVATLAYADSISELLRSMAEVARHIARGQTSQRAEGAGPAETSELARSLNAMADSLHLELQHVQMSAERLGVVLGSTRDGVVLIDNQENIELLNAAAEAMLGFRTAAAVGTRDTLLERYPDLAALLRQARRERIAINRRVSLSGTGAGVIRAAVVPLVSGRILITLQDLTEVYRAVDIRRDFVANVSHELRTPLTALAIMVENLLRGAIDEREVALDFLRRMAGEIDRLTKMVLELLLLSRLESERELLIKSDFPVSDLILEVIEDLRGLWGSKEQHLVHVAGSTVVHADRAKLKQVFINLLDNAIKFSPGGSSVKVEVLELASSVRIAVKDQGPGIPIEHLPRVYERFFKGASARGGGTGLGLAIVKHIIEAHGGTVAVESKTAGGATFVFVLPL
ncbi:MAG: Alkaline phosphatase synthesis sensor protein PhoR [Firmicutes bacterium]|nr:Alkaline phosphatase synthesis sensor protein PhoR [candidate division NPL-UPA2 bacterium]